MSWRRRHGAARSGARTASGAGERLDCRPRAPCCTWNACRGARTGLRLAAPLAQFPAGHHADRRDGVPRETVTAAASTRRSCPTTTTGCRAAATRSRSRYAQRVVGSTCRLRIGGAWALPRAEREPMAAKHRHVPHRRPCRGAAPAGVPRETTRADGPTAARADPRARSDAGRASPVRRSWDAPARRAVRCSAGGRPSGARASAHTRLRHAPARSRLPGPKREAGGSAPQRRPGLRHLRRRVSPGAPAGSSSPPRPARWSPPGSPARPP